MISLTKVQAFVAGSRVGPVTATFAAGVHSLLTDRADGGDVLLRVLARQCAYRGTVHAPASFAAVLRDTPLPEELSCAEYIHMASVFRKVARKPTDTLGHYGLGEWAAVPIAKVPKAERKALAIAEAQTSRCPLVILESPLTQVTPSAAAAIEDALGQRAADRVCVFSTSNADLATLHSDTTMVLKGGVVLGQIAAADAQFLDGNYRIECDDPGRLHSLLSRAAGPALGLRIGEGTLFTELRGAGDQPSRSLDVAKLVTRAAAEGGINIRKFEKESLLPEVIRARLVAQLQNARTANLPPQAPPPRGGPP